MALYDFADAKDRMILSSIAAYAMLWVVRISITAHGTAYRPGFHPWRIGLKTYYLGPVDNLLVEVGEGIMCSLVIVALLAAITVAWQWLKRNNRRDIY